MAPNGHNRMMFLARERILPLGVSLRTTPRPPPQGVAMQHLLARLVLTSQRLWRTRPLPDDLDLATIQRNLMRRMGWLCILLTCVLVAIDMGTQMMVSAWPMLVFPDVFGTAYTVELPVLGEARCGGAVLHLVDHPVNLGLPGTRGRWQAAQVNRAATARGQPPGGLVNGRGFALPYGGASR